MTLLCKCGNTCNDGSWDGTHRATCHRCGRQWEYRRMEDGQDWVEVVTSWEERCAKYMRERDEARKEVERLKKELDDEMGKAGEWIDIRTHRERVAAAVARISDRARKMESERAEAVELLRSAWGHIPQWETSVRNPIADFLAGQPAQAKPVVDDAMVEQAAAAAWNVAANRKWDEIPEEWKPFYRAAMRAGLERARKGEG